jgi:hypothetical protein
MEHEKLDEAAGRLGPDARHRLLDRHRRGDWLFVRQTQVHWGT